MVDLHVRLTDVEANGITVAAQQLGVSRDELLRRAIGPLIDEYAPVYGEGLRRMNKGQLMFLWPWDRLVA